MGDDKRQTQVVAVKAAKESHKLPIKGLKKLFRKLVAFVHKKKEARGSGRGGVWQKQIIMGDKCEPLDFSGVITYDSNGNQVMNGTPVKHSRASGRLYEKKENKV